MGRNGPASDKRRQRCLATTQRACLRGLAAASAGARSLRSRLATTDWWEVAYVQSCRATSSTSSKHDPQARPAARARKYALHAAVFGAPARCAAVAGIALLMTIALVSSPHAADVSRMLLAFPFRRCRLRSCGRRTPRGRMQPHGDNVVSRSALFLSISMMCVALPRKGRTGLFGSASVAIAHRRLRAYGLRLIAGAT